VPGANTGVKVPLLNVRPLSVASDEITLNVAEGPTAADELPARSVTCPSLG